MNIVDKYRELGSYRAAGRACGVDHKTVKAVVERFERGEVEVARKRVARIMREHGWCGQIGRVRVRTTRRDKTAAPAPDLVGRDFTPAAPDRLWM